MRHPNPEEVAKLRGRQETLAAAELAHREAQMFYLRAVSAVAEACNAPADAILDDNGSWQFMRVVGQGQDGKPVTEPLVADE